MHGNGADLAVFIGGVIIRSCFGITAAAVDRVLKLVIIYRGQTPLLCHTSKNVEKLADAFCFGRAAS